MEPNPDWTVCDLCRTRSRLRNVLRRLVHTGSSIRKALVGNMETRGFTSTETIKAYEGWGSWGVGNFYNTYSLHCHHQNDSALRLCEPF